MDGTLHEIRRPLHDDEKQSSLTYGHCWRSHRPNGSGGFFRALFGTESSLGESVMYWLVMDKKVLLSQWYIIEI